MEFPLPRFADLWVARPHQLRAHPSCIILTHKARHLWKAFRCLPRSSANPAIVRSVASSYRPCDFLGHDHQSKTLIPANGRQPPQYHPHDHIVSPIAAPLGLLQFTTVTTNTTTNSSSIFHTAIQEAETRNYHHFEQAFSVVLASANPTLLLATPPLRIIEELVTLVDMHGVVAVVIRFLVAGKVLQSWYHQAGSRE